MLAERILYEDAEFLAFNKNPGELVQGDRRGTASLIDLLCAHGNGAFFQPVHRLDRPASGVVLFAKTKEFFTVLTGLFRERAVDKLYWAVVEKKPALATGELRHRLVPDRRTNFVMARAATGGDGDAILFYRLIGTSDRYFFLEVKPATGQQHQIRAQLAAAGFPIKGDVKYGARRGISDRSILLHARSIAFTHPGTRRPVFVQAPPPEHVLWDLFASADQTPLPPDGI